MAFKKIKRILFDPVAFHLSKRRLKSFLIRSDIQEVINATKEYTGYSYYDRISMSQKNAEILALGERVKALHPKVVLEIGTRKGGTLFTWCRITNPELVISVDLPGGIHGGGYNPKKKKLYKEFVSDKPNTCIYLIQKDSHLRETLEEVLKILDSKRIDFLFIDGDHTYQGVKMDFEMYAPLVRKGGVIAFHDIVPNHTSHEDAKTIEVPKLWLEIKTKYVYEEYISSEGASWMGIGLIEIHSCPFIPNNALGIQK